MSNPYNEFTDEDWAEHFAQKKRDLEELKAIFRIRRHWLRVRSLRIGPSGIFFNEGGRLFSFVWWRGKILHLCLVILPHVWVLYWLKGKGWRPELKHRNWGLVNEQT